MKNLEEVFDEVAQSEELQAKFAAEQTTEKWVALVKELGGDTTVEELASYLSDRDNKEGKLSDKSLEQVIGGLIPDPVSCPVEVVSEQQYDYENQIHPNCGGHIVNKGCLWSFCRCEKCGETHYFYGAFFDWKK